MTARVLVVDDILSNVKLLEAKLEAEYFEVITAGNGEQALARVEKDIPDIVLLDVMMPGMDGFSVLRALRARSDAAAVPVVFLTARTQEADEYFRAGAIGIISKPFEPEDLLRRVRAYAEVPAHA